MNMYKLSKQAQSEWINGKPGFVARFKLLLCQRGEA